MKVCAPAVASLLHPTENCCSVCMFEQKDTRLQEYLASSKGDQSKRDRLLRLVTTEVGDLRASEKKESIQWFENKLRSIWNEAAVETNGTHHFKTGLMLCYDDESCIGAHDVECARQVCAAQMVSMREWIAAEVNKETPDAAAGDGQAVSVEGPAASVSTRVTLPMPRGPAIHSGATAGATGETSGARNKQQRKSKRQLGQPATPLAELQEKAATQAEKAARAAEARIAADTARRAAETARENLEMADTVGGGEEGPSQQSTNSVRSEAEVACDEADAFAKSQEKQAQAAEAEERVVQRAVAAIKTRAKAKKTREDKKAKGLAANVRQAMNVAEKHFREVNADRFAHYKKKPVPKPGQTDEEAEEQRRENVALLKQRLKGARDAAAIKWWEANPDAKNNIRWSNKFDKLPGHMVMMQDDNDGALAARSSLLTDSHSPVFARSDSHGKKIETT